MPQRRDRRAASRGAAAAWHRGRTQGAATHWYGYSPALRKAGGNWTEADLDKFLTSPSKFLPGTSKTIIGIPDAKQRADIIAALKKAP